MPSDLWKNWRGGRVSAFRGESESHVTDRGEGPLFRRWQILVVVAAALLATGPAAHACSGLTKVLNACEEGRDPKPGPKPATSSSARAEAALLADLNAERAHLGLRRLASSPAATALARRHARAMAERGKAYHNPSLGSSSTRSQLGRPRTLGENVGVGPSSGDVHHGFMRSTKHRANILSGAYDSVGVGAVVDGYSVYVVEVFLGRGSSWTSGAMLGGGGSGRRGSTLARAGWPIAPPAEPGSTIDWAAESLPGGLPVEPYSRPVAPIALAGILLLGVTAGRARLSR